MEEWRETFEHRGMRFEACFKKRPFREGIEVQVQVEGTVITVSELGLGKMAALEKIKLEIDRVNSPKHK